MNESGGGRQKVKSQKLKKAIQIYIMSGSINNLKSTTNVPYLFVPRHF
jgi:hypothetical protein